MKRYIRLCILLLLPLFLYTLSFQAEAASLETRALWISSVYNLDYPSRTGLSATALQAEADEIIAYAMQNHITDLYLQVRSSGDALYASTIFPWSQYLSGKSGVAPNGNFDPLAYFVQQGHAFGIRIHAWINPYILTRQKAETREAAFALLPANHPARDIADAVVFHSNGRLYLDLGHPDARALILDGITEILEHYDVDGIHFDDYFYPGQDFADDATYAAFGNGLSLEHFRRQSVNTLIAQVYAAVHQTRDDVVFGVSPSGIWANETHNALGSNTNGQESYYDLYADSRKWVQDGIVDYLIPQIYWHIGHQSADFTTLATWWNKVAAGTGVKLYLGLGAYRMDEADHDPAWDDTGEIQRQLEICKQLEHVTGVSLYRYRSCKNNADLTDLLSTHFETEAASIENATTEDPLSSIKQSFHQKKLTLLTPGMSTIGAPGNTLQIFATAPQNSNVTAYYAGNAYDLTGSKGEYSGEIPLSEEPNTSPILLVANKCGMLLVTLSPSTVTVPEEVASVKAITISTTNNSHTTTLILDAPCNAEISMQERIVTLDLFPCQFAPLLDDAFFLSQSVSEQEFRRTYTFTVPETVQHVRIEQISTRLRLIFELNTSKSGAS